MRLQREKHLKTCNRAPFAQLPISSIKRQKFNRFQFLWVLTLGSTLCQNMEITARRDADQTPRSRAIPDDQGQSDTCTVAALAKAIIEGRVIKYVRILMMDVSLTNCPFSFALLEDRREPRGG